MPQLAEYVFVGQSTIGISLFKLETPYADPHVRCCERCDAKTSAYSICFFQTAWNQHGLKAVPSEAAAVHSHICLAFNVHRSHDLSYGARQAAEALLILIE